MFVNYAKTNLLHLSWRHDVTVRRTSAGGLTTRDWLESLAADTAEGAGSVVTVRRL